MCISFFVCFFLECLWSLFSKVCLYYLYGSLVSFFSVSHFLFCSWVWSVPCLCSPRPGSSFPLCLCVTSGCFVSCLPLFFSLCELIVCHSLPLFVWHFTFFWFYCSYSILAFSFPHVLSASLGPFTLFFHALCASVSLCFLWFSISPVLSILISSLLSPFYWLLRLSASSWVCVSPSLMSCTLLSLHIFCASVCLLMCACLWQRGF